MKPRFARQLLPVLLLLMVSVEHTSADLFDQARQSMRLHEPRLDASGVTLRGGVGLQTGQQGNTLNLLRIQASTGGGCGSFDFGTSIVQAFEELPEVFEGLVGAAVQSLPMLILCYASPTLCDLAKHWQALVNLSIQARYAQCQQVQMAMAYAGLRLRGGQTSQCLEDQVDAGASLSDAMRTCHGDVRSIRAPDGSRRQSVELIGETLHAAGASQETQALASELLGTVTISANGGRLGHSQDRRPGAYLRRFEGHQSTSREALLAAIQEYQLTGQISETTLRQVSVPGQPIPRAAIEALATLQGDPVRYESMVAKLTTGLAVTRLTWECGELQEQLAGAAEGNSQLTDEQRRILDKRIEAVGRELNSVLKKAEVVGQHLQPALTALLQEYQAVQHVATQAGLRAPSPQPRQTPYRGQLPAGYGQ